eukprot:8673559-Pyramimonas_sp.AAC.1
MREPSPRNQPPSWVKSTEFGAGVVSGRGADAYRRQPEAPAGRQVKPIQGRRTVNSEFAIRSNGGAPGNRNKRGGEAPGALQAENARLAAEC